MAKVNRKGVNLHLAETPRGEHQVRKGNKIVSRHPTHVEAMTALLAARGF